jgi:2-polyprenyl-3-methyl-5-hydroxy-6-metoxy-1,4-benzoquinol methylase
MTLESVLVCPICGGESFNYLLTTRDYTVSQKDFQLQKCNTCTFVVTSPRPDEDSISDFYKSEKYISHTGGRKTFMDKVYIKARNITLKWKRELISNYKQDGNILDYGCGTGEFLLCMKENGWNINGVEPSETARAKATVLTKTEIFEELKAVKTKYDIITLWHVLEHIHNLNQKIDELIKNLNDDGTIFIAVPNRESEDANKYGNYWAGYDVPRHLWHFSQNNMKQLLKKHGLSLMATEPMKLDAYYVSMLSENYKNSDGLSIINLVKAFFSGLKSNSRAHKTGSHSSQIYIAKRS